MKTKEIWTKLTPRGCEPMLLGTYSLSLVRNLDIAETAPDVDKPAWRAPSQNEKHFSVTFEATYDCNFRCKYCFMNEDESLTTVHGKMDLNTVKAYLDKFANPKKISSLSISYMGGEPTLNMDLLLRTYEYARKIYKTVHFGLTTNGSRLMIPLKDATTIQNLNPELKNLTIGEWLARTRHSMTYSFDGPPGAQNSSRVFAGGNPTFDIVMAGLEHLKAVNPDYAKRIQFRATLFNNLKEVTFKDRLVFFNGLIERGIGGSVHFEPASGCADEFAGDMTLLEEQHYDAADWFIAQVKAGKSPSWSDIANRACVRLYSKSPNTRNCGAGNNYFTCGVNGDIFACHRTTGAKVGSIKEGIDYEEMSRWANNSMMFVTKCRTCPIRYVCGGNCRAENCVEGGDTHAVSERCCRVKFIRLYTAAKILAALTKEEAARMFQAKKQTCKPSLASPAKP